MTHAVQLRAAMLASISILTMAFTAPAIAPASPIARAFDPVAVDSFMTTQMARHGIPGLALAITHGDQVGHVRVYGQAKDGMPVTSQTQCRIASLSKSFIALACSTWLKAGRLA